MSSQVLVRLICFRLYGFHTHLRVQRRAGKPLAFFLLTCGPRFSPIPPVSNRQTNPTYHPPLASPRVPPPPEHHHTLPTRFSPLKQLLHHHPNTARTGQDSFTHRTSTVKRPIVYCCPVEGKASTDLSLSIDTRTTPLGTTLRLRCDARLHHSYLVSPEGACLSCSRCSRRPKATFTFSHLLQTPQPACTLGENSWGLIA